MTSRRPEDEHLAHAPLRELLGSDEILKPRPAFKARLRSNLVIAPPVPTGWRLTLPSGQQLAPVSSAMAMVLLVSITALAAFFVSDIVLPTGFPDADVDAPVLVEPDQEAPLEGAPASDQPADGASRDDAAREAPGGPGTGLDEDDPTNAGSSETLDDPSAEREGGSGSADGAGLPVSPRGGAPAAPVVPAATPASPAPPAEDPANPPKQVPVDPAPPAEPTEEPAPPPTATPYVAPGRETRPPLPSPTPDPEPSETPTEAPSPIAPDRAG